MKNHLITISKYIAMLFLLCSGTSCQATENDSTNTVLPSMEPHAFSASQTYTESAVSTVTPSFTSAPILDHLIPDQPTRIQIPTISHAVLENQLSDWQANNDCLLPCWGGVTPGINSWEDAKSLFSTVTEIDRLNENTDCVFGQCNYLSWHDPNNDRFHGIVVSKSNSIIYRVRVQIDSSTQAYNIHDMLSLYGHPERVLIFTTTFVNDEKLPFDLILLYPTYQFGIRYTWRAELSDNIISACSQEGLVYLFITQQAEKWGDDEILEYFYGGGDTTSVNLQSLEDVTYIDENGFYEIFMNTNNGCIVTPAEFWP